MRWLVAVIAPLIAAVPVLAEGIVFWDNFDYGWGTECNSNRNQAAFTTAWPIVGGCNSLQVDDDYDGTCPDGFRGWDPLFYVEHGRDQFLQNVKNLVPLIYDLDPSMDAVNGSNEEPLVLEVYVNMKPDNQKERATTFWIQLFAADDLAPNNQNLIHNDCVLTNETPSNPHNSIAFGGYPKLLPCVECPNLPECQPPDGPPLLNADAFYNGDRWTLLETDVPVPGPALRPAPGASWWTITIKTDTVDITVDSDAYGVVTRTDIPRYHTGPFQAIGLGSCEKSDYPSYIDHVVLSGGYLTTLVTGACCLVDGSCNNVTAAECVAQNGTWNGEGSICAGVICCPVPWADIDFDGDVDQVDLGLWQRCYSGPGYAYAEGCECYDRHAVTGMQGGDGDVDFSDFIWFGYCATGPTVPLDIYNPPANCMP
ncbi:MAG: hypothetical protein JSV03_10315 [Planctomycetota bacterium]|nr:MAG: hypothetical protein JSV03_10315 [Planctomycetota bacterium]